ncbi:A-kinase anchor protein 12b isoform X1 [Tachysurus ichikawai]
MGANASAQRDAKSPEDTSAMEERAADLSESRCGHDDDDTVDAKEMRRLHLNDSAIKTQEIKKRNNSC